MAFNIKTLESLPSHKQNDYIANELTILSEQERLLPLATIMDKLNNVQLQHLSPALKQFKKELAMVVEQSDSIKTDVSLEDMGIRVLNEIPERFIGIL